MGSVVSLMGSIRRIGLALAVAAAVMIVVAMVFYVDQLVTERWFKFWTGLLLLAMAGRAGVGIWARQRPMPLLAPDQTSATIILPGAVGLLASNITVGIFFLWIIAVMGGKFYELGHTLELSENIILMALVIIAFCVMIVCFGVSMARMPPVILRISISPTHIEFREIRRCIRLELASLKYDTLLATEGDVEGLIFQTPRGERWIPVHRAGPNEREAIRSLAQWLASRVAPAGRRRRLLEGEAGLMYRTIGLMAVTAVLGMWGFALLFLVGAFWVQWAFWGTVNIGLLGPIFVCSIALGMVFWAGPGRSWLVKLFRTRWWGRASRERRDGFAVWIEDRLGPESYSRTCFTEGLLRESGGRLILEMGERSLTIDPADVVVLTAQWNPWGIIDMPDHRWLARRSDLEWHGADGARHLVALYARAGRSYWQDWRLDRRLAAALERWRAGEAGCIAALPRGPCWTAAVPGLVFLLLLAIAPQLHIHAIKSKVYTGEWQPLRTRPIDQAAPMVISRNAIDPDRVLFLNIPSNNPGDSSVNWMPEIWCGDVIARQYRPMSAIWSLFVYASHMPEPPSHVFDRSSGGIMPTLGITELHSTFSSLPPKIVSLETRRARPLPNLPPFRWIKTALYRDELLFCVITPPWTLSIPDENEFGVYEIGADEWRPLGRMDRDDDADPVFFPGGRHVLLGERVVNVETGGIKEVGLPPDIEALPRGYPTVDLFWFAREDRLCLYVPRGLLGRECGAVWELDPESARFVRWTALPEGQSLASADGARWLLRDDRDDERGWFSATKFDDAPSTKSMIMDPFVESMMMPGMAGLMGAAGDSSGDATTDSPDMLGEFMPAGAPGADDLPTTPVIITLSLFDAGTLEVTPLFEQPCYEFEFYQFHLSAGESCVLIYGGMSLTENYASPPRWEALRFEIRD